MIRSAGRRTTEIVLLFIGLLLAVVFAVNGWREHFFTGLHEHWDPKSMGEWMAWNSQQILQGNFFLPDYNANYFYPHSYSLAFGETLWPESFIYAFLYASTGNIFLSFNGTLLFFWAVAGLCMFALLRELSVTRVVSYMGGFVFCLLPYNLAQAHEINMRLVFLMPLLLLLLIRWLRRPSVANVLVYCAGFWLVLTSCIYYTVIGSVPLLSVLIAYLFNDRQLFRRREFYVTGALGAMVISAICAVYLYPYAALHLDGNYTRTGADHFKYHAQIAHYLTTRYSAFWPGLFAPATRPAESVLSPGLPLGFLFLACLGAWGTRFLWSMNTMPLRQRPVPAATVVLWGAFLGIVLLNLTFPEPPWPQALNRTLLPLGVASITLSLFYPLTRQHASDNGPIITGIAAGAVVCFFVSLGPVITMGPDSHLVKLAPGPMAWALESIPFFKAVRGLTRFAVVVQLFIVVASCYILDKLVRRRPTAMIACVVIPLLMFYDGVRLRYDAGFADYVNQTSSTVMQRVKELPGHSVLFQMPMGTRQFDSEIVMNTIGDFHLVINGVSGFEPPQYEEYRRRTVGSREWGIQDLTQWLSEIWPPVYVILNHAAKGRIEGGWRKPFPMEEMETLWELQDKDAYYSLYKLRSGVINASPITRRIRSDLLRANPVLTFTARADSAAAAHPTTFHVTLNSHPVTTGVLSSDWTRYQVEMPANRIGSLVGDEVMLTQMPGAAPDSAQHSWEVKYVTFLPHQTIAPQANE